MKACFFDLDGTLIDSRADLVATVNETRRDKGLAELAAEVVLSHVGHGARHLLAHALAEVEQTPALWELFRRHYRANMTRRVTLYPGVAETLERLATRGWRLGVNTSKPAFATKAILDHFGLTPLFRGAIVAGGDCEALKPSPLPLRQCAALMEGHCLSPEDWMVGDSAADVLCAANAGVKSAFCTFGFGRLEGAPCTVRLDRFDELLRHLTEQ